MSFPEGLTFDLSGGTKAKAVGRPLDGWAGLTFKLQLNLGAELHLPLEDAIHTLPKFSHEDGLVPPNSKSASGLAVLTIPASMEFLVNNRALRFQNHQELPLINYRGDTRRT